MKPTKTNWSNPLVKFGGVLLGIGFMLGGFAWADAKKARLETNDLAVSLTARKVVTQDNGLEQLLPAERAFPGEVIQYDALCVNQSMKPLDSVSPTLPIPKGMVFVPNSAQPAPAEASTDGRTFARIPLKRKVLTSTGQEREEEVPPTEYRALRWHLGKLASGARATVSARTKLIPAGQ